MTTDEKTRYSRQISVVSIGETGQESLLKSKVAIVGCGALGSMVAMQLAAAGVGALAIADFDTIDISNLQRQFFFKTSEAGCPKAEVLRGRINDLNPGCEVETFVRLVGAAQARQIFSECDFVVDATDNPASKAMVGEVCRELGKSCCIAGVSEFHGQVMTIAPGDVTFSEAFAGDTDSAFMPCSIGGVVGPAAALCASIQAGEALKHITGAGSTLAGKLMTFDLMTNSFNVFVL